MNIAIIIRSKQELIDVYDKLISDGYTFNLVQHKDIIEYMSLRYDVNFPNGACMYFRTYKNNKAFAYCYANSYKGLMEFYNTKDPEIDSSYSILEASQYLNKFDKIDISKIKEDRYAIEIESIDDLRRSLLYYLTLGFQELQQYTDWYNFRTNLEDILCQIDINSDYKYLHYANSNHYLSLFPLRYLDKHTIYKSSDITINKDGNKIEKLLVKSILNEIIVNGEVVKNYNKILSAVNKLLNETE